ncbi:myosin-VIIa-like isoform X2 [Bacillus rossius redtenbacheri]|uniref:myosin-VIIa-like isoform X2 n=1 Tax=Bacillus rossius redtenbacheri TaxID=93214 RepID=UPI002FDCA460
MGNSLTCEGRDDVADFANIRSAMKVLDFSPEDTWDIFKLLAAMLHLGNTKYTSTVVFNMDASEIPDQVHIQKIAAMLGVTKELLTDALTKKTIFAQGEKVVSHLSSAKALEARDAFVKGIYGRLFVYIVSQVNSTIYKSSAGIKNSIGVLDIFGFENFETNSFEQLCINYANENLQQFFVQHIFKLEQEEYKREGISWQNMAFVDNQDILDMIGMKPINIMALIDEESLFPNGTDKSLLNKMNSSHGKNKNYNEPRSNEDQSFGLNHFAGVVSYDVKDFLEKNRDSFSADLKQLIYISSNKFLKNLFADDLAQAESSKKRNYSLSLQFRKSLESLMKTLGSCHPFFVRCIKPNHFKKPKVFDRNLCCRQLRYSGMMETAKIRRAGFPIRHGFKEFVDRYRMLVPGIPHASKTDCKEASAKICAAVLGSGSAVAEVYQLGKSKVFLKDAHDTILEQLRERVLAKSILILQRSIKTWVYRRRFLKLREAAIVFQKHWRGREPRKRFLCIRKGYLRLQALIRSRVLRSKYQQSQAYMVKFQAICRGYLIRKAYKEKTEFKMKRLQELMLLRKQEEAQLKKMGNKNYKAVAEENYRKRLIELQKEVHDSELGADVESLGDDDYVQLVDDIFGDIIEKSPSTPQTPTKIITNVFGDLGAARQHSEEVIPMPRFPAPVKVDLSEFNFRKFAMTYFRGNINFQYSRRPIRHSLLELPHPGDQLAARALWITILRFMGDMAEPRYETEIPDKTPIMAQVNQTLGKTLSNRKALADVTTQQNGVNAKSRRKMISMTLKRTDKLKENVRHGLLQDDAYSNWLESRRTTNLEKLHFIIGHGILRPELRDEIYCQICKQLTNNPTKASYARGWILLSLCVGCFPPSETFVNYLKEFIREGPVGYAPYCEARLERTLANGTRLQPPSWVELQATKYKNPIEIPVIFMDGSVKKLTADSATTAAELTEQLCQNIQLKDQFGFSLFIALFDKVSSLGNGQEHVMDAISQCEQYAKEQGAPERAAPWKMYFRKEVFSPWHDPAEDAVATNLIYHQVVRGVKCGEYRCDKESDIAMMAAQQFYVEYGSRFDTTLISNVLPNYIPDQFLKSGGEYAVSRWEKSVVEAYKKCYYVKEKTSDIKAKEDVVTYAKIKWPLLFSRFFDAQRLSGTQLPTSHIIVAVNWTGVYFVNDEEEVILELSFPEILSVVCHKSNLGFAHSFTLSTVQGHEFVLQCSTADEFQDLVNYLLNGLKKRSQYVVAMKDYQPPGEGVNLLTLQRGDLVVLDPGTTGETLMASSWSVGTVERNSQRGHFPLETVYILPSLSRPHDKILDEFKKEGVFDKQKPLPQVSVVNTKQRLHTLENYARQNFRSNQKTSASRPQTLTSARRLSAEELWKHSREPLKLPLLSKLLAHEELAQEACRAFTAVLKYMGDLPTRQGRGGVEHTDLIFRGPLRNDMLRDETYCQIMRQLTDNRNKLSEERGWELMWMASGLFAPSQNLLKELTMFLNTRTNPLSKLSVERLQRTLRSGQRKQPPHQVELEAIQHRIKHIYHKIYFPNDTDEAYEVNSSTRARDLCTDIVEHLNLRSGEGFCLFIKILDKIFSVPHKEFFFDYVRELSEWVKKTRPGRSAGGTEYQIFFMKKLWVNAAPGRDRNADLTFHFPQEVPKYLRGYHKVAKTEAVKLAGLLFRTKFGDVNESQSIVPRILEDLVPSNLVKLYSIKDWTKHITASYQQQIGMTSDEAKIAFLQHIYVWPTFGSAFFEVKQTTEFAFPEIITIAINLKGISIIDPGTKEILAVHPFTHIFNWSSGNTFFNIQIGNLVHGSKLLCETPLGYKMDDLLTSYIKLLQSTIIRSSSQQLTEL